MTVGVGSIGLATAITAGTPQQIIYNKPTGLTAGEGLVALTAVRSGTNAAPLVAPTGWTQKGPGVTVNGIVVQAFQKNTVDSTDQNVTTTYTFNWVGGTTPSNGSATGVGGRLFRITGMDPTNPIVAQGGQSSSVSLITFTGGLTPGVANTLLLLLGVSQNTGTTNFSGANANPATVNSNPTWTSQGGSTAHSSFSDAYAYGLFTPATTTGNITWTVGAIANNELYAVAIQPAAVAGAQNSNFLAFMR